MSAVDEVRVAIEKQISAVQLEIGRLEAARRALRGEDPLVLTGEQINAARARARKQHKALRVAATPKTRRKQVRRGERQAEVAALVERKPGLSTSSLVEHLGIAESQVYKITARLAAAGKIQGSSKGWHPSSTQEGI